MKRAARARAPNARNAATMSSSKSKHPSWADYTRRAEQVVNAAFAIGRASRSSVRRATPQVAAAPTRALLARWTLDRAATGAAHGDDLVGQLGVIENYRQRVLAAARWSLSGELAVQAIRAAFAVVLARLLTPRDFGLLAMLTIVTQFVAANSDAGFEEALVQKRDLAEAHRSSVFWAMLVSGVALTVGLLLMAPWIAAFYGVEELTPLAQALSVLFLLRTAGTVPRALMARRLDFRVPAALGGVAALVAGTAAVLLAWRGFGVLSLAVQLLVSAAVESLLLFRVCGWRPRLEFRARALRDLLGFSAYRPAARTLGYWARNMDQLLIGKLLGSDALGLYARGYNLARVPQVFVSRSIVHVMFPSLALIQDDADRVRAVYLRTTGAVALATFPMCMGLFATAEPFVVGVLGSQWRETVPTLQLLSLASLVQSISTLAGALYLSHRGAPTFSSA